MRLAAASLAAVAAMSAAGAADAASVEIRDAVARVTVIPEDRSDVKVEVLVANPRLPLYVSGGGDRVVVDGDLRHRIRGCHRGSGEDARIGVSGVGTVAYRDMPQVIVHAPRDVRLEAGGAVIGAVGRSASLELDDSGCSVWTIADVAGPATLNESGAAKVRMGAADRLQAHVSGAADIHATQARHGLEAQLSGVGDIQVERADGPVEARVSGVGKVQVGDGHASSLAASVSGMGKVEFRGVADSLDASISGLGSVWVKDVTGPVSKSISGGGSVHIGGR